ncbi:MAG: hypothetical protein AseanaTS_17330 [Candidatus Pelagadaptatus aseana]|uniref:hypothetical protein n=1 Tax=Candidatus Pelagadaptatus aseana TaxID=3120508 RepID=UPI0039B20A77
MALHIISNPSALSQCNGLIADTDSVLFRDCDSDSIHPEDWQKLLKIGAKLYWLDKSPPPKRYSETQFTVVNFSGFVKLCTEHDNSISWN